MSITPLPPVTEPYLLGVDLYHGDSIGDNPDTIQFHDIAAAGASFVILKAGQSVTSNDPTFRVWWDRIPQAGMKRGSYLFFDPGTDPIAQAEHALNLAPPKKGDILHVLDVETYGKAVGSNAKAAAQHIKNKTGRWPIIYTGLSFYQDYLEQFFPADIHTLWLAKYGPRPLTQSAFWQYTDSGRITGINHALDLDVFFGDMAALETHCY